MTRGEIGLGVFPFFFGNCSALGVKFGGVYKGLKLTKWLGLRSVEVNVDYKSVVKALEGEGS